MHCPACEHQNKSTARFCEGCGTRLFQACTSCGEEAGPQARFCPACGAPMQRPGNGVLRGRSGGDQGSLREAVAGPRLPTESEPAGERRQLTVMFCDLVGSTQLSQQLDPEEWRYVLAQYQNAATAAVRRFGGHIAKELGDGLLIYFGWPDAREDDPERAVRAGLGIIDALVPVNARLEAGDGARLAVRVGMHTGPVVIADGGDVFGETPNVAARVQAAAAPDTVVITAATQRLVAGIFVVEDQGAQRLKGVHEPIGVYRVVQPSGVRSRLDVAAGRLTAFVGREVELATLVDRWERSQDGEGQNVLVLGEAGVGKSRLVYQLRERLAAVPHTWLECRSTPYTEGTPFYSVIELVAQGVSLTADDTPAEKIEKIERGLTLAGLTSPEAVPLMADFLGLPAAEGYPALQMSPELQRRKTIELLAAWNLALAEVQPLVVLVEDLHWSDPSSLELVARLIAHSATARVLLIGTARPEFSAPWPARSNLTTLQLARLTKRQAREMVAALCAGSGEQRMGVGAAAAARPLTAEMLDALVARADGIPLYIEELTKAVVEPGVARGVEAIPATLADSLMARLDRLSAAKEVAQRAAVLGREFPYELLAAVAGTDEAALRQGLAPLIEAEILFTRGEPPHATYTFKHALVQEAAYGSLLKRTRQQLHGRVVDVLLQQFPERVESEPELVARHAEAAGCVDAATTYYGRAGERAQARSAHEEARKEFRKAMALLDTRPGGPDRDERELSPQLALGASLIAARGYSHAETEAAYERAGALAEATGDAVRRGMARTGLAFFYYTRGEVERGRTVGADVLAAAEARGDREQAVNGHVAVGTPEHFQGKFASSLAHCERAIALYDPAQDHQHVRVLGGDQGVAALGWAAWNLWHVGRPDAALARAREAVVLANRLDHPFSVAFALFFETNVDWLRRDIAAQREHGAEVVALSEAQGFPLWLGLGRALHASACVMAGDPGALPEILDGLARAAEIGNQLGAPILLLLLAEAQQAAGQLSEAQGTVATALAVAAQTGQPLFDSDLHRLDGDLVLASGGARDEAAARYHHALAIARAQGARSLELRAATRLARLWRDQDKRTEARAALAPLCASFSEGFDTADLIDAKALLAEIGGT